MKNNNIDDIKIGILSCGKKKRLTGLHKAKDLYISPYFKLSYQYLKYIIKVDKVYIISAKYGIIDENHIINHYEASFKNKTNIINFDDINKQLNNIRSNYNNYKIFYLAGVDYLKYISFNEFDNILMHKLSIGYRMQKMKNELDAKKEDIS
jgi:hypothetical protein